MQQSFVLNTQLLLSVDRALTTVLALALELDSAVNESKQSVVLADAYIDTGMDVGASGGPECCRPERTDRQHA